jgi:hypothetical protein
MRREWGQRVVSWSLIDFERIVASGGAVSQAMSRVSIVWEAF